MMRLFNAIKTYLANRRRLGKTWTDYDAFMQANFPHVVASRDKHYH